MDPVDDASTNGSIETTYVEDEIKESYIDYAMSVIVGRALPDVRDGLKPVQRRILYAMHDLGLTHGGSHKKSARIVGEVLGKYHPHGDSAVYNTLVRMAQDFSLRYPLIDPQGNFGSVDGDNPAAMRYTEARLDKISSEMLDNLDEDTVDFRPNFDDSLEEPKVLPARLPNLLINGASGIAVGMATNIPPHQLGEVIDAVNHQIRNPDCSIQDLMEHIRGPDFPTGGLICSKEGIEKLYRTGRGKIIVRGKVHVEEPDNSRAPRLIITEIPYRVNKAKMIEKVADRVNEDVIEGIRDIRDESDRQGMRVVVELKKGASPEVVENQLYQYTRLEHTFGATMLALVDNEPEVLNLKEIIDNYIQHRINVIRRRTEYRLQKARDRAHLLAGYKIAIANIDDVVEIIKESNQPADAKETLIDRYEVSERQADAILRMQLQKLTSMQVEKIENEYEELQEDIEYYETVLDDENKVRELIVEELEELKDTYNDERRTGFSDRPLDISKEDLIEDEPTLLTLSKEGYIKRSDPTEFRVQHRGGKGIYGADPREGDEISDVFAAKTHDYLLVFTSRGLCYWLKVYDVPEGGRRTQGMPIINLLDVEPDETVRAVIPVRELSDGYLVMATREGRIKKTDIEAFSRPRSGGIIGISMPENDELVSVRKTVGSDDLILASRTGYAIRFDESDVRPTGRDTQGVKGIDLAGEDTVSGLAVVQEGKDLLTITEKGFGKRTEFNKYRAQTRGGKGLKNIKNTEENGGVVAVEAVDNDDELVLISNRGILLRTPCEEISQYGRNTQGVKVMNVMEDQRVTGITLESAVPDSSDIEETEESAEANQSD
jgi:DNA gyrase subunit A